MGFTAAGREKELYFYVGLVKFFTFFPLLVHTRPLRPPLQYEDGLKMMRKVTKTYG